MGHGEGGAGGSAGARAAGGEVGAGSGAHEGADAADADAADRGCPQTGQNLPPGNWAPQLRHLLVPWLRPSVMKRSLDVEPTADGATNE